MKTVIQIGNEILALPQTPMSDKISETFLVCTMSEQKGGVVPEEVQNSMQFKIIEDRTRDLNISPWVIAFLTTIVKTPASCVLYSAALVAIQDKYPGQQITFDEFTKPNAFPNGFPTHDELEPVWVGQKIHDGPPDNMLDRDACWNSKTERVH